MTKNRPYAAACDQNKQPILDVLKEQLSEPQNVLEISSGTGQHAVFFAEKMPHLNWQTTELAENLPGIRAWIEHAGSDKLPPPLELDVGSKQWPAMTVGGVFCANAIHIMSWQHVIHLFEGLVNVASPGAKLIMYGPFNYNNQYTSESNRQFDAMLRQRDPLSGIRNFEDVDQLAVAVGFSLLRDYAMPANNRILVWRREG